MPEQIGEIIEATTTEFIAQTYDLHQMPDFGSLVMVSDSFQRIYGLVYEAGTSSIDPGRRPTPRGQGEDNEDDIYRKNPQLNKLLRTTFSVMVVGYSNGTTVSHHLPPKPPRVHGFVNLCDQDETALFYSSLDFLNLITSTRLAVPTDELIATSIRQAGEARGNDRPFLVNAGKRLAILLAGDLNRLNGILGRIKP